MSGIDYTPREPKTKAANRYTQESRQRLSEASRFPRSNDTKKRMSDGRRERFVNQNPLEEGEVYISYHIKDGGRRHVTAMLIEGVEISLNGINWFKVKETGKPIKEELKRLK